MSLPSEMQAIGDQIISSFDARFACICHLKDEVDGLLQSLRKARAKMAEELRAYLKDVTEERQKEVEQLLKEFEKDRLEMRAHQVVELTAFHLHLEKETEELLKKFRHEREEFEKELAELDAVWMEIAATMEQKRRQSCPR
ncbi:MAG: hypothetical protein ACYCX4_00620 [Bacillota bacterium]